MKFTCSNVYTRLGGEVEVEAESAEAAACKYARDFEHCWGENEDHENTVLVRRPDGSEVAYLVTTKLSYVAEETDI